MGYCRKGSLRLGWSTGLTGELVLEAARMPLGAIWSASGDLVGHRLMACLSGRACRTQQAVCNHQEEEDANRAGTDPADLFGADSGQTWQLTLCIRVARCRRSKPETLAFLTCLNEMILDIA